MQCLRHIRSVEDAEDFVRRVLEEKNLKKINEATLEIVSAEMQIQEVISKQTLTSDKYRLSPYKSDESRIELRERILDELFEKERLSNDDSICLGNGGARPRESVMCERQAFLITGLPASGKSCISNSISDSHHAYVLDSDYAKRKIPEYRANFGATITHEESSLIVNGADEQKFQFDGEDSLLSRCIKEGYNIVLPRIGYNRNKVLGIAMQLYECGYSVHFVLVRLSREKATQRAYARYKSSHRYVPLPLIFDGYANDPTIVYYDLKRENGGNKVFSSFSMISTDVPKNAMPKLLDSEGETPITEDFVDFSFMKSYNKVHFS